MRSHALFLALMSGAVATYPCDAVAQENGIGRVEIVFLDTAFAVSLSVPVTEILGLEQTLENDKTRTSVAVAVSDLSEPLKLFVVPDKAECFTATANVALSAVGLGQVTDNGQDSGGNRNDFQAEYLIQCQNIQAVETMHFAYFDHFPKAEKLVVQVDRSGQRSSQELTRTAPDLSL